MRVLLHGERFAAPRPILARAALDLPALGAFGQSPLGFGAAYFACDASGLPGAALGPAAGALFGFPAGPAHRDEQRVRGRRGRLLARPPLPAAPAPLAREARRAPAQFRLRRPHARGRRLPSDAAAAAHPRAADRQLLVRLHEGRFPAYMCGTAIGYLPGTAAAVYSGAAGRSSLLGGGTARRVATVAVILVLIALGRVITDVARGLLEAFTDDLDEAEDEARAEAEEALFGGGEFSARRRIDERPRRLASPHSLARGDVHITCILDVLTYTRPSKPASSSRTRSSPASSASTKRRRVERGPPSRRLPACGSRGWRAARVFAAARACAAW